MPAPRLRPLGAHQLVAGDDRVALGGQPSLEDLDAWAARGVKHVVNTRSRAENQTIGFDMAAETAKRGMSYVEIPMGGADGASPAVREALTRTLGDNQGPTVVHCLGGPRAAHAYAAHLYATGQITVDELADFGWPGGLSRDTLAALVSLPPG